jgi:hypothetical protein
MMTRLQNGSDNTFTLKNVLYVPGAMMNLFSVRQATSMGAGVEFAGSTCIVKAPCTQGVIIQAIPRGGPYRFKTMHTSESAMAATAGETAQLWHRRFGHMGYDNMAKLPNMVSGLKVTAEEFKKAGESSCEPCIMSKQHRLPFKSSNTGQRKCWTYFTWMSVGTCKSHHLEEASTWQPSWMTSQDCQWSCLYQARRRSYQQ